MAFAPSSDFKAGFRAALILSLDSILSLRERRYPRQSKSAKPQKAMALIANSDLGNCDVGCDLIWEE